MNPLETLRYHVTGAIERGEKQAIAGISASKPIHPKPPIGYVKRTDELAALGFAVRFVGIGCNCYAVVSKNGKDVSKQLNGSNLNSFLAGVRAAS
jgi:hypothetical protein